MEDEGTMARREAEGPSSTEPDWSRERRRAAWDPPRSLLASIRSYQSSRTPFGRKWAVLRHRFWAAVTGADIPLNCRIGGGLLLPHPQGVVIHPEAVIGPNCTIFQQVTLGSQGEGRGVPVLEGRVDVGAGAKILGPVRVGRHARIGANAVVLSDVPAGRVAVGVPATLVGGDDAFRRAGDRTGRARGSSGSGTGVRSERTGLLGVERPAEVLAE